MKTLQEYTGIMPGDIPLFDQLRQQYGGDYLEKMDENDKQYLLYWLVSVEFGHFDVDSISKEFEEMATQLPTVLPENARTGLIEALVVQLRLRG
jgi:hypothetical protein